MSTKMTARDWIAVLLVAVLAALVAVGAQRALGLGSRAAGPISGALAAMAGYLTYLQRRKAS